MRPANPERELQLLVLLQQELLVASETAGGLAGNCKAGATDTATRPVTELTLDDDDGGP